MTDEGYQVVACPLPALVCVTEGVARERYALPQELAAAQTTPIEAVACAHLASDLSLFGLAGSPTWVADLRLVAPTRLGIVITEKDATAAAQQVVALVREHLAILATAAASAGVQVLAAPAAAESDVTVVEVHHTEEVDAMHQQPICNVGMASLPP